MIEFSRVRENERYETCDDAPGLPKVPSAEKIDVDANSKITGLF